MKQSVLIIGAGLGGLFTGAILAKEGFRVTILEKNATIGGGLQTFKRFGELFDTGMHIIGGLLPGGNIWKICRYLGIADKVRLRRVDSDCSDRLYFAEDRQYYTIAQGREGFVASLAASFPEEAENLRRYTDALYALVDKVDLFNLRPSDGQMSLFTGAGNFLMPADAFIASYVRDPKLRSVLAYMNPLYGGRAGITPAYIHAIISTLYINGSSRFVGGSSHFADLLASVVTDHGGTVLTGEGAERIILSSSPQAASPSSASTGAALPRVDSVLSSKGRTYTADYYVSAIHPCTMLRLIDGKGLPKAYRDRLDSLPNAHSAFSLYVKFKPGSFPYINHSEYYMTRYADVWHFSQPDKPWPLGFLFMTPPEEQQGPWASKALVTAPMAFQLVEKWRDTTVGHRGDDYEEWKQQKADALLKQIEEIHPGFRQCIEAMNTASPLTIRDFYGAKDGTICGFSKDCHNIALSQVPVVTKLPNLLLTGQNNNLHGICGVPLTAINTCEAILGINTIINKINGCQKES